MDSKWLLSDICRKGAIMVHHPMYRRQKFHPIMCLKAIFI